MSRMSTRRFKAKKTDKVYPILVAVLAIAMIACWAVVWSKCSQYEKGSTKYQMNIVAEQLKKEFGGEITYKRAKSTDIGIDYNVYKDGENFATASLVEREEKAILGFSLYDIGDIKGNKSLSFLALPNDKVSVGGMDVAQMSVSEAGIYLPGLKALANHKTNKTCNVPQYNEYVVENQFTIPTIDGEGLILLDTNKGTLVAHEMPVKLQEELKTWTKDFLVKYTDYVVYGKGFDKIKDNLFYTSPIYNTVYKFQSLWDYYYDYVVTMREFNYSDFVQYTDDIVSLRVKYHYTQTLGKKQVQENRPDINIYLYKNNGSWQIIEMEISEWAE